MGLCIVDLLCLVLLLGLKSVTVHSAIQKTVSVKHQDRQQVLAGTDKVVTLQYA